MYQLALPFRLRGRDGEVVVVVEPSSDPDDLGLGLVAAGYEPRAFVGFPVMEAQVRYEGRGPRAWMGWLQVVSRRGLDGTHLDEVDVLPLGREDSPLYAFGYKPTLSDCPANPGHPDEDWIADSYLVAIPDVVRSKVLEPVVGFTWGYRLRAGSPERLLPPAPLPAGSWDEHVELVLAPRYPGWTFLPSVAATLTRDDEREP